MKYIKFASIIMLSILVNTVYSQTLKGTVQEFHNKHKEAIPGVNILWLGNQKGTTTNAKGEFSIEKYSQYSKLIVSFVGYQNDTIDIKENQTEINIILSNSKVLDEFVILEKQKGSYISYAKTIQTAVITSEGLKKAACCNLSESFESNASVDVSYSDAVTGAKQIQLLGLAGTYSQILTENIPNLRGLATPYGLGFVPGPWMQAIQISKGTSSVVNGYESISGQINVEFLKPEESPRFYFNGYGSNEGKIELNSFVSTKLNNRWGTMLLAHGEYFDQKIDHNHDGFMDMPTSKQYHIMNRWNYNSSKLESKYAVSILQERRNGGQMDFKENEDLGKSTNYGIGIETNRYQIFAKNGILFPDYEDMSIGTILSGTLHEQKSYFGLTKYNGEQKSGYANFLYQNKLINHENKITAGLSYNYDEYNESLNDSSFKRIESVPGIFTELTFLFFDKFTVLAGFRADLYDKNTTFYTPRLHLKYTLGEHTTIRASVGKGYKTPQIFAENTNLFATSRKWIFHEKIKPEEAINYGINITRHFEFNHEKELQLSVDYYRTEFMNQMIVDIDKNPQEVHFYNLQGLSYSNSAQIEASMEVVKGLELTTAFRINDVKMTTDNKLQDKPLIHKYKGIFTFTYNTNNAKWKFDGTLQYNGGGRMPNTLLNNEAHRLPTNFGEYYNILAQITRHFKHFEVYLGGENLADFKIKHPILASHAPFGKYFDSSMIWGPISGRMFYAGFRYTLK